MKPQSICQTLWQQPYIHKARGTFHSTILCKVVSNQLFCSAVFSVSTTKSFKHALPLSAAATNKSCLQQFNTHSLHIHTLWLKWESLLINMFKLTGTHPCFSTSVRREAETNVNFRHTLLSVRQMSAPVSCLVVFGVISTMISALDVSWKWDVGYQL